MKSIKTILLSLIVLFTCNSSYAFVLNTGDSLLQIEISELVFDFDNNLIESSFENLTYIKEISKSLPLESIEVLVCNIKGKYPKSFGQTSEFQRALNLAAYLKKELKFEEIHPKSPSGCVDKASPDNILVILTFYIE